VEVEQQLSKTIDFYFDFSSPYGYLASTRIESIASKHNRVVQWSPILLGAVFKVSGQAPLTSYPLKGDYALKDFDRAAREHNTPYKHPDVFPVGAVAASRACCWLKASTDKKASEQITPFVHGIFKAYYVDGRNISEADEVLAVAKSVGIDAEALATGIAEQTIKDALRIDIENAMKLGVFGSPTTVVDGELFWGSDRLEQIDRWLERGGW